MTINMIILGEAGVAGGMQIATADAAAAIAAHHGGFGYTKCKSSTHPAVALNIRNAEADRLAAEVASLAGETKTLAVIVALKERRQRLQQQVQAASRAQASLVQQLDQIGLCCAARAISDSRSAEAILGYDATGLPS